MSSLADNAVNEDKYSDLYRSGDMVISFTFEQLVHQSYQNAKKSGDNELMSRIENNWEDIFGVPYFEAEPTPVGLLGGPGQGKTAVMNASAKRAASFMGLNFVSDRNTVPTKNDFFFDVVTLGGALSPNPIKGTQLPATKSFKDSLGNTVEERVMDTILPANVTKSKYARASFILLDDAPNAHPDVLTAVYDLLKPENESEFSNIYYSYTGNTGDDGAAAKKFNTAIASRCRLMYMKDLPMDFIKRLEDEYRNDVAETYIRSIVLGFIQQNGNLLNTPPIKAQMDKTQFACSRTWTQYSRQLSQFLRPFAWRMKNKPSTVTEQATSDLLAAVQTLAVDNLGRDVGNKIYSHALRVIQDADPICRDILASGQVTADIKERIKRQYDNGESASDMDFMFAMADSLSNHAAEQYINAYGAGDSDAMENALKGFVAGMYDTLRSPKTPEYVQHCYQRFFSACVSKSNDDPAFGYRTEKGVMLIGNKFYGDVSRASSANPLSVTEYVNPLGKKVRLIDQMLNVSSIRAATDADINALSEQNKALKDAFNRCAPKATPQSAPTVSTQAAPQSNTSPAQAPKVSNVSTAAPVKQMAPSF